MFDTLYFDYRLQAILDTIKNKKCTGGETPANKAFDFVALTSV